MLPNKRAIVTGGTRGIGRAIVKELASKSCCGVLFSDVAFIYNSCDECAEELQAEIHNPATKILAFKADATSLDQAEATVQEAVEKLGGALIYAKRGKDVLFALVHDVFGYWTLSKGSVKGDEDVKEGTKREIKEEIDVVLALSF